MKKESLKQQAYNIIKNKIITCEYPPNFLLNEEKLKEEIGASRTPVRDALSRLEQENLVRILPKKGIMVAPLTIREINSIYEARMLVEPYGIEHYAGNIDRDQFLYYEKKCKETEKLIQENADIYNEVYDTDDKLHLEFINATENEYFKALYERIYYQNRRLRILSGVKSKDRLAATQREHLKIIEACLEERWSDAAAEMKEHLLHSKRASFEAMIEGGDMLL
ncbi:MAG: GntR family transcriptional regulator [Lachnospiraceae bacterium]|nr:GntR family transcriptional regulator [Lachnospiraceae bacterium]